MYYRALYVSDLLGMGARMHRAPCVVSRRKSQQISGKTAIYLDSIANEGAFDQDTSTIAGVSKCIEKLK